MGVNVRALALAVNPHAKDLYIRAVANRVDVKEGQVDVGVLTWLVLVHRRRTVRSDRHQGPQFSL